jgi:hypothetical protein
MHFSLDNCLMKCLLKFSRASLCGWSSAMARLGLRSNRAINLDMEAEGRLPKEYRMKAGSFMSHLFFWYIVPVLRLGNKKNYEAQMVPDLAGRESYSVRLEALRQAFQGQARSSREGMTLLRALLRAEWGRLSLSLVLRLLYSLLVMANPAATRLVISYISEGRADPMTGWGLFGLFLLVSLAINFTGTQGYFQMSLVGNLLGSGLTNLLAEKALLYPSLNLKDYNTGDLATLSSVDATRLNTFPFYMSSSLYIPLQLGIGIYLMYTAVGVAFTAGLLALLVINFLGYLNSKWQARFN